MTSHNIERDRARAWLDGVYGELGGLTILYFMVGFIGMALALTGSWGIDSGLFIIPLAVLVVVSLYGPGNRWRPTGMTRASIRVASLLLGVVLAALAS